MNAENVAETSRDHVEDEIVSMLGDARVDGIVRSLSRKYPHNASRVEDAVCEAFIQVIGASKRRHIDNVAAYLTRTAENHLLKSLGREPLWGSINEMGELDESDQFGAIDAKDTFRALKQATTNWNERIRVVVNLVLDAAYLGEYLTAEDLAYETSAILGEEVEPATASMWKSRGLKRLSEEFLKSQSSLDKESK